MKKLLLRALCLLCAVSMFSCGGNEADTTNGATEAVAETTAEVTEEPEEPVVEWTPPTYEELVDKLMAEGKVVADFIRRNDFIYGDAQINPAINWRTLSVEEAINPDERIVACDRMVSWILFRAGFIDQDYRHGIDLVRYFEEHNFEKIESSRLVKAGDIVFVNPDKNGNPAHVFMCAGTNLRYDGGSNERINGLRGDQPFNEPIGAFVEAYRPSPEKMPNPALLEVLYEQPTADEGAVAENSTVIFEQDKKEGTLALGNHYTPGKEYDQYELHLNLTSTSENNTTILSEATYIGVRLPDKRKNARDPGGIFLSFNGTNKAGLFFGRGGDRYVWTNSPAVLTLPEDFSTEHKISVVDTGDVIKFYMYTSSGEQYLICSLNVCEEYNQAVAHDHDGNIVYSGSAVLNEDGYFGVWSYKANTAMTDISIKAS